MKRGGPLKRKTGIVSRSQLKARNPMKTKRTKDDRTAEEKRWHDKLREMGCIVTGKTSGVTIHHCHGGSLLDTGITKGGGIRTSHWLTIPLDVNLHSMGAHAIDGSMGVRTWEATFGSQLWYLGEVMRVTGVDIFAKAGIERPNWSRVDKFPK